LLCRFFLCIFNKLCFVVHHFFCSIFWADRYAVSLRSTLCHRCRLSDVGGAPQLSDSWEFCFPCHFFLPSLPYMRLHTFSCMTMITIRNIINLQIWFSFMFKYFFLFCYFFVWQWNLRTELLHKVKQWNKTGVVNDFYMAGVLTKYSSFVPKSINIASALQYP